MKKDWVAYLLAACCVFGPAGLHRFYLGRPITGVLYLLTWGFFGAGTLLDLIRLPRMVAAENRKLLGTGVHFHVHALPGGQVILPALPPASTGAKDRAAQRELALLSCAQRHGGVLTTALAAVETQLTLAEVEKELARLRERGVCTVDVSEAGAELYVFAGLRSTKPLM